MVTAKFGGTAMTAQNFDKVKALVSDSCGCVVVSAVGKEYTGDVKTTDLLKAHFLGDGSAWARVEDKYRRLVAVNGIDIDVDKLLCSAKLRSRSFDLAYCMSLGEEMSAKIVAAALGCCYVEAERCISFQNGKLCLSSTLKNLRSAFDGVKLGVVGGFYGGCNNGRQLFSRGGSDVTGCVCALATGSSLYENWTDACGVCRANPKLVSGAQTVCGLSYRQMYLLARGGAEVLHPDAVRLAERRALPIKVGSYLAPNGPSTTVSNAPNLSAFLSVTERERGGVIVTTLLHAMPLSEVFLRLEKAFSGFGRCGEALGTVYRFSSRQIFRCEVSQQTVKIWSDSSVLRRLYNQFIC